MNTINQPNYFDIETFLTDLKDRVQGIVLVIEEALAQVRNTEFCVPGETNDHHAYRQHRIVSGPLSELGETVMQSLLKLGLTDEEVGVRMKVSPHGVGARRRKWGRAYGQKG